MPGFELERRLSAGPGGETWRARAAGDEPVVVRRGPAAALRREADLLRVLRVPHLARVRAVEGGEDGLELVLDADASETVEAVLERRGALSAGEAVTVAVPLAQVLAALHSRGLGLGAVEPADVLLTGAGVPVHTGAGLRGGAEPEDDVLALAALVRRLVGDPLPGALADVLSGASDAAALAAQLPRVCPPVPVGAPAAAPARPETSEPARRPTPSRSVVAAVVILGVLVAAGTGWALGRAGPADVGLRVVPPSAVGATAPARPTQALVERQPAQVVDWTAVLDGLDRARERAFATGSLPGLAQVSAPGSPAAKADAAVLRRLARERSRALGVRHRLLAVDVVRADASTARLRVRDELGPARLVDRRGVVRSALPARPAATFLVDLVLTPAGWRLSAVAPG